MSSLIRKEVQKIKGYSLKSFPHQIKLNQNESPWDLPAELKAKALERLQSLSWNRYPTPFCDSLREKIAKREGWMTEGVLVSGGSNILIQALVLASAIGGKILTVSPGFSLYELQGHLFSNKVVHVPLNREDFSLPIDRFLKTLKKVKPQIVFLANPNAPTGNLLDPESLLKILQASRGLVVVDEAYFPFSGFTLFPYLKKFKNLVLVRTFSKAFSLGGVRLGYLLADPPLVAEFIKVVLPFSVGTLSQAVGEVVLENDSYVAERVRQTIQERERLYKELCQVKGLKVYPSKANFIIFQSKRSKEIFNGLVQKGILIRDVSSKDLPNTLRVTVGTFEENQRFLNEKEIL